MTADQTGTPDSRKKPLSLARSRHLLSRDESQLVVIDVQEKFVPHLTDPARLIEHCGLLIQGAKLLGVPISVSEQNTDKLGATVSPLREMLPAAAVKMRFSSAECLFGEAERKHRSRSQVVLCGIETHVCVLQTAFDLSSWGYDVYVVSDAVQSRFASDRDAALRRMDAAGIVLATTESVLFEWCETADAPEFREVSRLIKSRSKPEA